MLRSLLIISLSTFLLFIKAEAQNAPGYETSILYEKEQNYGILAHTKGIGLVYQTTRHKTVNNYRLYDFSFATIKHPKEIKMPNPDLAQTRPYVFGKLNALMTINAAIGARRILADRVTKESIRINWNYAIGPTLGILKPVYYDIKLPNPDLGQPDFIEARFDPDNEQYQQNTIGPSPFIKGITESSFIPGANAKTSLSFEWGNYDNRFYSIETGVMVNAFPWDVPIFAYINNDKVFVNLFLTLTYGTRK